MVAPATLLWIRAKLSAALELQREFCPVWDDLLLLEHPEVWAERNAHSRSSICNLSGCDESLPCNKACVGCGVVVHLSSGIFVETFQLPRGRTGAVFPDEGQDGGTIGAILVLRGNVHIVDAEEDLTPETVGNEVCERTGVCSYNATTRFGHSEFDLDEAL